MTVSRETRVTGWPQLFLLRLRQDRWWWALWGLALAVEPAVIGQTYRSTYGTAASREGLQRASEANAGLNLLYSRPIDLNTMGGFTTWRIHTFLLVLAGIVAALAVIRHTRAEEEAGRDELVRSAPVGVEANLTAVIATLGLAAVYVVILTTALLTGVGLPVSGSLLTGATFGSSMLVWGGVAAFVAQVFDSARSVRLTVMSGIAASYLLRGIADAASRDSVVRHVIWLSPVGWLEEARPYVGNRWWVVAASLAVTAALLSAAAVLQSRRDSGQGLMTDHSGASRAAPSLRNPWALVGRLERSSTIVWSLAMTIGGSMLGAIAPSIASILEGTPGDEDIIRSMGGQQSIVDAYFSAVLPIIAMITVVFALSILGQAASAESTGIAEEALSTSVSRERWLGAYVGWALIAPAVVVVLAGLGTGLAALAVGGADLPPVADVVAGALVVVPGMWLITALAVLAWTVSGRMWPAWTVFGVVVVIVWVGPAMHLPHWVLELSPFEHLPRLPGGSFDIVPVLVVLALTALCAVGSFVAYSRRDVA